MTLQRETHETTCGWRSLADNSLCGLTLADLDSMCRARFIERALYFKITFQIQVPENATKLAWGLMLWRDRGGLPDGML